MAFEQTDVQKIVDFQRCTTLKINFNNLETASPSNLEEGDMWFRSDGANRGLKVRKESTTEEFEAIASQTITSNAHILREESSTINSDGHILVTVTETIDSDAHVLATLEETINSDAEVV